MRKKHSTQKPYYNNLTSAVLMDLSTYPAAGLKDTFGSLNLTHLTLKTLKPDSISSQSTLLLLFRIVFFFDVLDYIFEQD